MTTKPAISARAADAHLVFAALQAIVQNDVFKPSPVTLLAGAVNGLRKALADAGVSGTLADLTAGGEEGAKTEFQARFDQAVTMADRKMDEMQLQYAAVNGMVASLEDKSTFFLTPEQMAQNDRERQHQSSYSGVGMFTRSVDGHVYVERAFVGGPAAQAGVHDFDRIITIDGQSTEGMTSQDVARHIRGPQGTSVSITVKRPGQADPFTFSITRQPITLPAVEYKMLNGHFGYIWLAQFSRGSTAEIEQALKDLRGQGMRSLVLDIRGNGGGFVDELNGVANALLPGGVTIFTEHSRRGLQTATTRGGTVLDPSTPLVVLIDKSTASTSELLAAAIQDSGRGKLVGVQTARSVRFSRTFPLPGGAGIEVTISLLTTGKGVDLETAGVTPDVVVELTSGDLDKGVDSQMQSALQVAAATH